MITAATALVGAGNFFADASKTVIQSTAAFIGAGQLVADGTITGAGALNGKVLGHLLVPVNLSPALCNLRLASTTRLAKSRALVYLADAFTELEFGLAIDVNNVKTGDTLAFRVYVNGAPLDIYSVTPTGTVAAHAIPATALFAGVGTFISTATLRMAAQAAYAGVGAWADVNARMILRPTAAFAGVSTFSSTPQLNDAWFCNVCWSRYIVCQSGNLEIRVRAFAGVGTQSTTAKLIMAGQCRVCWHWHADHKCRVAHAGGN